MNARSASTLLANANDITLLVHQNPDGDAVGSSVALKLGLAKLGKQVKIICTQSFPEIFTGIVSAVETEARLPQQTDLLIILDCSELHRTGFAKQLKSLKAKTIVVIDHHESGDLRKLSENIFSDNNAAATAELIYECLNELRVKITPEIATALLMGIYTDTGAFQHNNTTSSTLSLAARLVRYGADLSKISNTFLQTLSKPKRRLWGKILSELTINKFGMVCAVVPANLLVESGAEAADISGLANQLALTDEAKASLVLVETSQGWRGTLRTRCANVDLGRLATMLGGRGHKKAAGFTATKSVFSGKLIK